MPAGVITPQDVFKDLGTPDVPPNTELTALEAARARAWQQALATQIPFVISGFVLPSSGSLTNSVGAGDAVIDNLRVIVGAYTFTAPINSDTYFDLNSNGTYTVTSVASGAGAPILGAGRLRIGYVRSNASNITAAFTDANDSLGNWMRNRVSQPTCILGGPRVAGGITVFLPFPFDSPALELYDNDFMHNPSVNPSRIVTSKPGVYQFWCHVTMNGVYTSPQVQIWKNGSQAPGSNDFLMPTGQFLVLSGMVTANAGDYFELAVRSSGGGDSTAGASFQMTRMA